MKRLSSNFRQVINAYKKLRYLNEAERAKKN